MTNPNRRIFHDKLITALEKSPEAPLMLSGGVDSATILAGLLELEREPEIITFQLGEYQSPDVLVASDMCKTFDLTQYVVKIPQNEETLKQDIKTIVAAIGTTKKAHVQCTHPFLYVCPLIKQLGYSNVFIGFALDTICGMGRKIEILLHQEGEIAFRNSRINLLDVTNSTTTSSIPNYCNTWGINIVDPYRDPDLISFGVMQTWDDMHKPFQKAIAVEAFPNFWKKGRWYRKHESYQICSGIRDWHATLDNSPDMKKSQLSLRTTYKKVLNDSL